MAGARNNLGVHSNKKNTRASNIKYHSPAKRKSNTMLTKQFMQKTTSPDSRTNELTIDWGIRNWSEQTNGFWIDEKKTNIKSYSVHAYMYAMHFCWQK
jgi:hypothetical protein